MTDPKYPRFREAVRGPRAVPAAIATLLTWLMITDGDASAHEIGYLDAFRSAQRLDDELMTEIADIGRRASSGELAHCLKILSTMLTDEGKWLLLDLVLGMVLADGRIHFAEKVLIELVFDALGLPMQTFRQRYQEVTGRQYESAGDVSSARWWSESESRQRNGHREGAKDDGGQTRPPSGYTDEARRHSLAVLGLENDATMDQVVAAFRRLAKVHHPDRFQTLGPEAQKAAHETFIRIKNAYDLLRAA